MLFDFCSSLRVFLQRTKLDTDSGGLAPPWGPAVRTGPEAVPGPFVAPGGRKMASLDSSTLFRHLWACIQRFLSEIFKCICITVTHNRLCPNVIQKLLIQWLSVQLPGEGASFFSNGITPENTELFFSFFGTLSFHYTGL